MDSTLQMKARLKKGFFTCPVHNQEIAKLSSNTKFSSLQYIPNYPCPTLPKLGLAEMSVLQHWLTLAPPLPERKNRFSYSDFKDQEMHIWGQNEKKLCLLAIHSPLLLLGRPEIPQ